MTVSSNEFYEKEFMLNGKLGYIKYTLKVDVSESERAGSVFKLIETKVLYFSIDGVKL